MVKSAYMDEKLENGELKSNLETMATRVFERSQTMLGARQAIESNKFAGHYEPLDYSRNTSIDKRSLERTKLKADTYF